VVVVVGCVNENDCDGGGGCLELSIICECLVGRTEDGRRRNVQFHKKIQESLNNYIKAEADGGFPI
jgi:hypothetical protein